MPIFLALALAAVSSLAMCISAAPASAAFHYGFERTLEAEKPSPGPFGLLAASSVAVNDQSGQTLVADSSTGAVDVFETAGEHKQLAVWEGSAVTNFPGTEAGSFGGGAVPVFGSGTVSVAANNATGKVYVLDSSDNLVDVLGPSGEFLCQITGTKPASIAGQEHECNGAAGSDTPSHGFSTPRGITVDQATGEIYVLDPEHEAVDVFSAGGAYVGARSIALSSVPGGFPGGEHSVLTRSVAVDDFNGHVYVSVGGGNPPPGARVYEFDAAGKYVTTWTGGECQAGSGNVGEPKACSTPAGSFGEGLVSVAADNATGRIYVSENNSELTYVFDASGRYLTQFSHSFRTPQGTAVDQASGRVYVSDDSEPFGPGVVDVFERLVVPDVTTEAASELTPVSATLDGRVNPQGLPLTPLTGCHFDWGATASYGQSAPCVPAAAEIPADSSPHAVTAHLTGLVSGTTYHYRLVAGNANGSSTDEPPRDSTFQTPGPLIADESVSEVAATSASFAAGIVPFGHPTSYYFQYGTAPDFSGAVAAPAAPGEAIGSGATEINVSRHVQTGLVAGTLYYLRVVAVSELQTGVPTLVYGETRTFTTQAIGVSPLPDGRAWEQVSPLDKHGAHLEATEFASEQAVQASANGGAVTYLASAPTEPEPEGFANRMQVLSTRGPGGWESHDIGTPQVGVAGVGGFGGGQLYKQFASDLSVAALQPFGAFDPSLSSQASEQTAFLRTNYHGADATSLCTPRTEACYTPLVTGRPGFANVPEGTHFSTTGECPGNGNQTSCGPEFRAGTPDMAHVVVSSNVPLTGTPLEFAAGRHALYEWTAGSLKLVSVVPQTGGGEVQAAPGDIGDGNRDEQGGSGGGDGQRGTQQTADVVSTSGSRVVWTNSEDGHLYLSDTSGAQTKAVQLDAELTGQEPVFQTANAELTELYFTDEGDLYRYTVAEAGGLERLTEGAEVQGTVLGASTDGSWLYFVADGAIAGTTGATAGEPNLYVLHDGSTRFIAALSPKDGPDWAHHGGVDESTARVSPNGHWLAFMSQQRLTGYDNRDASSGKPDQEVYLYNGESRHLICASCRPTGARPSGVESAGKTEGGANASLALGGDGIWNTGEWVAANLPGWTLHGYQPRYLSNDGRVFFNSSDALVPQDVNGTQDVYEWEPSGTVNGEGKPVCTEASATFSERSGGCLGLISSGEGTQESAFVDASESGGDVYFITANRVLAQDGDTSLDVYDAHECSSSAPCLGPPATQPPACSNLDSCRAAPAPPPEVFSSPASATFSGAGNPPPPPGAKPKTPAQIRAEHLTKALKACHKDKKKSKRKACERAAHKKYATKASKTSKRRR